MPDRISHSHPTIETHRGTITRAGSTRRPVVSVPTGNDETFPPETIVRVEVAEQEYHSRLHTRGENTEFNGVFESPRFARNPSEQRNSLPTWIKQHNELAIGREILIDIIDPGFKYGFRIPGHDATYTVTSPPKRSLHDIAQQLDT